MSAMDKRDYDPTRDPLEQVQAMDGAQELFVPVHGHILLYPEEIAIIDHPSFQRLRRVRQLGLAHSSLSGALIVSLRQVDLVWRLERVRNSCRVKNRQYETRQWV